MNQILHNLFDKLTFLVRDGFFHILVGNTLIKIIGFISSIVIVRLVSKESYANFVYAENLYSYAIAIAGLGMSSGILIYCSKEEDIVKKTNYFKFSLFFGVIIQIIVSTLIFLYFCLYEDYYGSAKIIMIFLFLFPVGSYVISCIMAYVRSCFDNKLFVKLSLVQTIVIFLGSVILGWLIGIEGIPFARYIGFVSVILLSCDFLKRNTRQNKNKHLNKSEIKIYLKASISLLAINMFSQLMISNETLLVNKILKNAVDTANYKVAILIPSQLIFVASSVATYLFPKMAKMKEAKEIWQYSKKIAVLTLTLIMSIVLVAIPITPLIIKVVYGTQYLETIGLLRMFWIVYGINAAIRMIPSNILSAIGEIKFNSVLTMVSCIVHFWVDYYFIKTRGIYGVAIASIVVYMFSGVLSWVYLWKICSNKH